MMDCYLKKSCKWFKNLKVYEQNSNYEIQANIKHITTSYITNIDNTSDREKINTRLSIRIINKQSNCIVYDDEISISQFYIYASSDKFLSNQVAVKKIKKDNTESTVRQFINKIKNLMVSVMDKGTQILLIKEFLISNEEVLLINQVSDELEIFYLSIIKYYADKQGIKINVDDNNETIRAEDDLFGQKEIIIYRITNTKKLASALDSFKKKIIFTDYKIYKKMKADFNCINGYQSEHDIVFFIRDELKINNDELLYYCKNNPVLLYSEISKYLINSNQYSSDQTLIDEKNHILDIGKSIFENKK